MILSAAVHMADHDILLERRGTSCGLMGPLLVDSGHRPTYQTEAKIWSMIITSYSRTRWVHIKLGVPLGSVLAPLLFINSLFGWHRLYCLICDVVGHLSSDDAQAFVHGPSLFQLLSIASIQSLTNWLHSWMSSNRLNFNYSKFQFICCVTPQQLHKLDFALLSEKFRLFSFLVNCPRFWCCPWMSTYLYRAHV